MTFITLTTDFGNKDFFVGALKGAILSRVPSARLVDISHDIQPFDIIQGAFVARNMWHEFPQGTIHLIGVHCVYQQNPRFVAARHSGHYFIAPDNGLLTLLFDELPQSELRNLAAQPQAHFAVKNVFAEAVAHLCSDAPFETLGEFAAPILQRINIHPVITPDRIRGTIIHIDNFENAVVNIRRDLFEKAANGRSFSLYFRRNDPITFRSENYADVPVGEPLCLFNSAGFLEIAINLGKAATLFNLKVEDVVELVFE